MTRAFPSMILVGSLLLVSSQAHATNYFIDNVAGSDANAGTSEGSAWQSIEPLEETTLHPGDRVLFKAGGTFPVTNRFAVDGWDPGIWPQADSSGVEGRSGHVHKLRHGPDADHHEPKRC